MRNLITVILYCMITGSAYRVSAAGVNITTYGGVGDGHTLNTWAIQTAIDACSKTGGGSVILPAGKSSPAPLC
ncbi:glycosyl hydrolase family 28-related protein [Chitinophaga rupis]|uniref:glycosyl hydrolase family 28-related protein n=1 Tax=Chitinophaga rupis TaxID=573321 RepID=UPI001EE46BA5|nr:glycosyl hydrolase family 28-related protein [Chitinophaga rupis]